MSDSELEFVSVLMMFVVGAAIAFFCLWCYYKLAKLVGYAAKDRGFEFTSWFVFALIASPLVAGALLFFLGIGQDFRRKHHIASDDDE